MTGEARETTQPGTGARRSRGSLVARLYALGVALVVFCVSWSAIAARPWQERPAKKADPRMLALSARENQLRHEALALQRRLKRQWALYERNLQIRQSEIAAARLRHAQEVAAAAAAAQEIAAAAAAAAAAPARAGRLKAATSLAVALSTPAPAPGASPIPTPPPAPAPAPEPAPTPEPPPPTIVQLPPEVVIVELPPVTVSTTS